MYLFLPAGLANILPPIAVLLFPTQNYPLDFNKTLRGHRIFGDHKTFRGLIIGTIMAGLLFFLQSYLYDHVVLFNDISLIDYSKTSPFFGFALGFGALAGDAIKSFFKRQIAIKPGQAWFPWDQIDWIIGSIVISIFFVSVSNQMIITYLLVGFILHLIIKSIGFLIKLNQSFI